MCTPKSLDSAMNDWKREREILRMSQFYSLPVEAMSQIKKPENLYTLPWEEPVTPIKPEEIDWSK